MLTLVTALLLNVQPCGPLDLPTVLALVEVRSDEVGIKQAEVLGAQADLAIAKALGILPLSSATILAGPVPAAHGTITHSTSSNRSLDGLGPFGRIDVTLVQPVWTWGALTAAKDAANAGVKARTLLVQDTLRQVQLRTLQLYWGTVLAKRLLGIAADVEKSLIQVDQTLTESLDKGKGDVTQADKYRVQVFRSELLQRKSEASRGLKLARTGLAATLGMEESALVLKDEPLPAPGDAAMPELSKVLAEAEQRRPDLMALDQAIHAREAEVRADEAVRLPLFFVGATFAYSYAPNRDIQTNPWINDYFRQLSAGVGVGVRQNLSFPTMNATLEKARAELNILKRQRQGLARLLTVEVQTGVADMISAEEKRVAAQSALTAGRSWFRSAGLNFGIGVTDAKTVVEAYTGYVKTQVDDAQARFDLLVARAHLDELTGKTLESQGENLCTLP